ASPEAFVRAACAAGLQAVAVTDHATVAAVAAVRSHAMGTGVRVVAGVELSVHDETGKEVHVLGLHLADLEMVDGALASVRGARVERARAIVGKLNALGVPVEMDAVLAES